VTVGGSDRLAGVSASIERDLPATGWDDPEHLSGPPIGTRLAKENVVRQVVGTLVMNIDLESLASFKQGLPLDDRLRSSIEGMVEAAAFRDGGAPEFVDIVLDNMRGHLSGGT
jgi:hypothetical protein